MKKKVVAVGAKVRIVRGRNVIADAAISQVLPKQRQVVLDRPVTAKAGDTLIISKP